MNATLTLPGCVITITLPEPAQLTVREREELLQAREVFRLARDHDMRLNEKELVADGGDYNWLFQLIGR